MATLQPVRMPNFAHLLLVFLMLSLVVARPALGQGSINVGKWQVGEPPLVGDVYYQFDATVVIERIWLEGDTNDFSIVDYNPIIVKKGQLLDIVISFAPKSRGPKTVVLKGTAVLFFGKGTVDFQPTTLTGTGIASKIAIDTKLLDFSKPTSGDDAHDQNSWTWLHHTRERRILIRNVGDPGTVLRGDFTISNRVKPDGSSGDADQTFNFVEQNGTTLTNQPIYRTVSGPVTINNLKVGQRGQTVTIQFKPGLDYTNVGPSNTPGTHLCTLGFSSNDPDAKSGSEIVDADARGPYPIIKSRMFDTSRSVASGNYLYVNNFLSASSGDNNDLKLMRFDEQLITNNGNRIPLPWNADQLLGGPRGYHLWGPMNLDGQLYRLGDAYVRDGTYDPSFNDPTKWTQEFFPPPPLPPVPSTLSYSVDQEYGWTAPWIEGYLFPQDDPLVNIGNIDYAPRGYVSIPNAHYTITRRVADAFEHSKLQWWQYIGSTDDNGLQELPFNP